MSLAIFRVQSRALKCLFASVYSPQRLSLLRASCGGAFEIKMADRGDSISRGSIEVCRIMVPDDANIAGNVHGGTTLKLIEEAGYIIATRHCNKTKPNKESKYNAALARVERTDFLQPVYIGEVVQVHAELGYPSKHSLEVKVSVWAENLMTGSRRLTNRAALWYVPVDVAHSKRGAKAVVGEVPMVENLSEIELEAGKGRYEYQKRARIEKEELFKKVLKNCFVIKNLCKGPKFIIWGFHRTGSPGASCSKLQ